MPKHPASHFSALIHMKLAYKFNVQVREAVVFSVNEQILIYNVLIILAVSLDKVVSFKHLLRYG